MLVNNRNTKVTQRRALFAFALAGLVSPVYATYPDLNSMLHNDPFVIVAPNNVYLSTAVFALPADLQQAALQSLSPLADGSLSMVSDVAMRQFYSALDDHLRKKDFGYVGMASGDTKEQDDTDPLAGEPIAGEQKVPVTKAPTKADDKAAKELNPETAKEASAATQALTQGEVVADQEAEDSSETAADTVVDMKIGDHQSGAWIQLIGSDVNQGERDAVLGYSAHVWGLLIGRDAKISERTKIGAAIGYEQARSYSDQTSGSFLDIKRFQLSFYGKREFSECFYLLGALTGAANGYDNKRKILVAPSSVSTVISNIARSEFSAWEFDAYLENGFTWKKENVRVNPKLFLTYSHIDPEGYQEQDAFNLDLNVKYQDMNAMSLAGGAKVEYDAIFAKAIVVPELHAYYFYNVINDKQIGTANFFAGAFAFLAQGAEPANSSIELGASLNVHSYRNVLVKVQYDYFARDDYHRHSGIIKVRYEWA